LQALRVLLGGRSGPRTKTEKRHPGLLVMRRVRHEAGGYPEVGVSSPAQGAAMGCTAVQPSHTSSEIDIGGSTSRGAAATQRPGRSRREATLDMHTCWGPAQERQRSLGLWGASQPPPAAWLAAAELQMTTWSASVGGGGDCCAAAMLKHTLVGAGRGSKSRGWRRVARSRGPFGGRGRCGIATVAS